jgi:hypothetical protein
MNRLRAFMAGRYGLDQLSIAFLLIGIVLNIISNFVAYLPLNILAMVVYVLAVLRMFSRNFTSRRAENAHFLKLWHPIKNFFFGFRTRARDSKTHKYFKCPGCRNTLRVPKGRGKLLITCPKCGERFERKT